VLKYVLLTAARNEAGYIDRTLESISAQTILPERWIIVDDASEDATAEVARGFAAEHEWIEVITAAEEGERSFASKARCIAAAYRKVQALDFEVVGNVDADTSFEQDHMEFLLGRFEENPRLGVAGTAYLEEGFDSRRGTMADRRHVSGQCQLFRRECWEDINGYVESPAGGVDWIAVRTARMKGWDTESFHERTFFHHKPMGTAGRSALRAKFHYGQKDYFLGGHPLWEVFRAGFQMRNRPYLVGGAALMAGYAWAWLRRLERPVSPQLAAFHQEEQLARLRELVFRKKHKGAE
jgi:glycosyltransferase involved in cell wall biosynthesis